MANPWFRMYSEFANDPKVQMMNEAMQRRYVMIMCMRCSNDLAKLSDAEIAFCLRISESELQESKSLFIENGLIDGEWEIIDWHKHKSSSFLRPASSIWRVIRSRIFERDDYTCQYCGSRGVRLECDHIVPVSRGGGNDDENLATACFDCNRSKRDRLLSEWRGS